MVALPSSLPELGRERDRVLRQVTDALRDDARVVAAWLLGSFGRGEADEWSDLDLQVAVEDDALEQVLNEPRQLLDLPGPPVLVQAGFPSTSFPGGRFWLVIYDGPVEIDWSIGPASKAVREEASQLLFEREPVRLARPAIAPSKEEIGPQVEKALEFFWAMAPIALKYAGRGHTRNAINMIGLMTPAYHLLWRALHAPDQLGRGMHHSNLPIEPEFEPYAIRLPAAITLADTLDTIDRMTTVVAQLHAPLSQQGHAVPHDMPRQIRSLMPIAREAAADGGSAPGRHSRR